MAKECKVPGCANQDRRGKFHGDLCMPCYNWLERQLGYLKTNKDDSRAYSNQLNDCVDFLKSAELCEIEERWDEEKINR